MVLFLRSSFSLRCTAPGKQVLDHFYSVILCAERAFIHVHVFTTQFFQEKYANQVVLLCNLGSHGFRVGFLQVHCTRVAPAGLLCYLMVTSGRI